MEERILTVLKQKCDVVTRKYFRTWSKRDPGELLSEAWTRVHSPPEGGGLSVLERIKAGWIPCWPSYLYRIAYSAHATLVASPRQRPLEAAEHVASLVDPAGDVEREDDLHWIEVHIKKFSRTPQEFAALLRLLFRNQSSAHVARDLGISVRTAQEWKRRCREYLISTARLAQ